MKNAKKYVLNFGLFVLLFFLTYYLVFRGQNLREIVDNVKRINTLYVVLGVIAMYGFYALGGLNLKLTLKTLGKDISIFKAIKFTQIEGFFSAITPAASGGQPMEIYYMSKEGINVSHAALALLIHIFGYQVTVVVLGLISAIALHDIFTPELTILFIVGIIFSFVTVVLYSIAVFSKKITNKLVHLFIKILKFLRFKNIEQKQDAIEEGLTVYHESSKFIKKHKKQFYRAILIAGLQLMVNYAIVWFTYKAFGLSEHSFLYLLAIQAILHCTVTSIPLPGSVGISETVFLLLYTQIFESSILTNALLLHRTINFYLFVIINLAVVLLNKLYLMITKKL